MGFSAALDTVSISFNSFFWMTIFRFFLLWHFQQSSWNRTLTYPHFAFIGYTHGFRFFRFHGFNHGCFLEVTLIRFVTQKTVPINKSIIQKLSVQVKYFTLSVNSFYDSSGNSPVPATTRCPWSGVRQQVHPADQCCWLQPLNSGRCNTGSEYVPFHPSVRWLQASYPWFHPEQNTGHIPRHTAWNTYLQNWKYRLFWIFLEMDV